MRPDEPTTETPSDPAPTQQERREGLSASELQQARIDTLSLSIRFRGCALHDAVCSAALRMADEIDRLRADNQRMAAELATWRHNVLVAQVPNGGDRT